MCNQYSSKASRRPAPLNGSITPPRQQVQQRLAGVKPSQPVVMPTPFLRRVRNHQLSSPVAAASCSRTVDQHQHQHQLAEANNRRCHFADRCQPRCFFEGELAKLRATTDAKRFPLYESVFRALDSLLRATCPSRTHVAAPKSLLAMCLRKIPEYVAELERWERQEAEDRGARCAAKDLGVSFEIYSDLESLGSVGGWRHLCLVVRAHGVRVIHEAFLEGLLDDDAAELLIRLCLEYMPQTECASLLDSFLMRQYSNPCGGAAVGNDLFSSPALRPLRLLKAVDVPEDCLMLGKLADLFSEGWLPAEWLLTEDFTSLWGPAARQLTSRQSSHQNVVDFITVSIQHLCRLMTARRRKGMPAAELRGREKARKILTTALSVLAAMVLLGREGAISEQPPGGESQHSRITAFSKRVEHILQVCITGLQEGRKGMQPRLDAYLLSLCAFLAFDTGAGAAAYATIEAAWEKGHVRSKGDESLARQYDVTLALVSAIAHGCSRGTHLSPNDHLSLLCDKLETLRLPGDALSNVRVDGAFSVAEHTGDLRHLAFAESLRARCGSASNGQQQTGKTQHGRSGKNGEQTPRAASYAGFRWDDDIGEWVVISNKSNNNSILPTAATAARRVTWGASSCLDDTTNFFASSTRSLRPRVQKSMSAADLDLDMGLDAVSDKRSDHAAELSADSGSSRLGSDDDEDDDDNENHEEAQRSFLDTSNTETSSVSSRASKPDMQAAPEAEAGLDLEPESEPEPEQEPEFGSGSGSGPGCASSSEPELEPEPEVDIETEVQVEADTRAMSFSPSSSVASRRTELGLLACRPRRLSKRCPVGPDELAAESGGGRTRGGWVGRRARRGRLPVGRSRTSTLLSLQPPTKPPPRTVVDGSIDAESDDELSFI